MYRGLGFFLMGGSISLLSLTLRKDFLLIMIDPLVPVPREFKHKRYGKLLLIWIARAGSSSTYSKIRLFSFPLWTQIKGIALM